MPSKILVPIDLTDKAGGERALAEAFKQAQAHGAEVTVLTVVPDLMAGIDWRYAIRGELGGSEDLDMGKIVEQAEKRLEELVRDNIPDDMRAETIARHGTIYDEVLDLAEEIGADQIILPAHRPKVSEYLLGSNAAKIVSHAKCSVTVLRDI